MKTNYHTHTYLCGHAKGTIEDYIKEAIENKYQIIGISDHGPLPDEITTQKIIHKYYFYRMNLKEYSQYVEDISKFKVIYKDKIKVLSGIEIEYIEGFDEYYELLNEQLDYVILAQHFFIDKDRDLELSGFRIENKDDLYAYMNSIIKAIKTGYFDLVAHPDMFMNKYIEWDKDTEYVTRKIMETAIKYGVAIEFNANGIRRKSVNTKDGKRFRYPRYEFWQLAKEYKGLKIIFNSDCHTPEQLNDKTIKYGRHLAREWGVELQDKL